MSLFRVTPGKLFVRLLAGLFFLLSSLTRAESLSQQTLLESTVERLKTDGLVIGTDFRQRQWLSAAPRLSVMHWQTNDDVIGSNETEALFELEVLTSAQRKLINHSERLVRDYQRLHNQQLKLTASGVVRELFWQAKLLQTELAHAEKVETQLKQLHRRTQSLVEAGERPEYAGIIVKQKHQAALSQVEEKRIALQQLDRVWQRLTGVSEVVTSLDEPPAEHQSMRTHPALENLQLKWQLALKAMQQSAAEQKSWGLSAGYKYIEGPNQSENQWGLGFSLPLDFSQSLSASDLVALQQQQKDLNQSLRETQIRLQLDIANAQSQLEQQKQKHQSNRQNAALSSHAIAQLDSLYQQGQIDTRLYVERLLEQLSYQQAAQLSQVELKLAQALLNQAKGISL